MFVQVRNRSPSEVRDGLSAREARDREAHFFAGTDPRFTLLDDGVKGVKALTRVLVQLQKEGIRSCMPEMKRQASFH